MQLSANALSNRVFAAAVPLVVCAILVGLPTVGRAQTEPGTGTIPGQAEAAVNSAAAASKNGGEAEPADVEEDGATSILVLGEDPWTTGTTIRWLRAFAEAQGDQLEITKKSSDGVSLADAIAALVMRGTASAEWDLVVVYETPHRVLVQRNESAVSADLADLATLADRVVWATAPVPGAPEAVENERSVLGDRLADGQRILHAPVAYARRAARQRLGETSQGAILGDQPSLAGDYLSACVLYVTMFGPPGAALPSEISVDPETSFRVPGDTAQRLRQAAVETVDRLRRVGIPQGQYVAELASPMRLAANDAPIATEDAGSLPIVADWNNDGRTDLLVSYVRRGRLDVFLNAGTDDAPVFEQETWIGPDQPQQEVPWQKSNDVGTTVFQAVDVDGDGNLDLLLGTARGELMLCHGKGNGAFGEPVPLRTANGVLRLPYLQRACWGDANEDGQPELVLGDADGAVYLSRLVSADTRIVWSAPEPLAIDGMPLSVSSDAAPFLADWNGDGRPDLLVGCADGSVIWAARTGHGDEAGWSPPLTLVSPCADDYLFAFPVREGGQLWEPVPGWSSCPAVVDLNGNGRADLLLGDTNCRIVNYRELTPKESEAMAELETRRRELESEISRLPEAPLRLKTELLDVTLELIATAQNRRYTRCGWVWFFGRQGNGAAAITSPGNSAE